MSSVISRSISVITPLFLAVFLLTGSAYGSGFGVFTQGASALGQADAVVAHLDGPSAIFFNPALINDLKGTQVEVGTTAIVADLEFKSDSTGKTEEAESNVHLPSTFYLTHQINDQLSAGLGVFFPFGLGTEWDDDWEGRHLATKSEVISYNINPVVSYRVTPKVSVAAGVNVLWLDAELERKVLINPALPEPDINQKFSGDGHGFGYNLGLAVKITDQMSFGASYRSKVEVDIEDGEAEFGFPASTLAASPGIDLLFPKTKGEATLDLPAVAMAGFSLKPNDRLTLGTTVRWEQWSVFEELRIDLAQEIGPPGQSTDVSVTARDWHDTWAFSLGGKYRLNDAVTLLGGYLFAKDAVPDRTFDPAIPDSDSHLFTIGTELDFNELKVAVAYGYQLQVNRDKNPNVQDAALGFEEANGTYEKALHLAGVSLTYAF